MYDITSFKSFSDVSYWANCIQVVLELQRFATANGALRKKKKRRNNVCLQESATDNVTIVMLGNKSDSATRQVQSLDGEVLAKV